LINTDRRNEIIASWLDFEHRYSSNLYYGAGTGNSNRWVGNKDSQLIFTAPHSVNHIREGNIKYADKMTGGLAELLAKLSNNQSLTVDGPPNGDPNWDDVAPFKDELLLHLKENSIVFDLHGMKDSYGIDVNIGMGKEPSKQSKNIAINLSKQLKTNNFIVSVDDPFDACHPYTITSFVQSHRGSAVQLEISSALRNPSDAPEKALIFVNTILEVVSSLQ
jgi:hypothetical protein